MKLSKLFDAVDFSEHVYDLFKSTLHEHMGDHAHHAAWAVHHRKEMFKNLNNKSAYHEHMSHRTAHREAFTSKFDSMHPARKKAIGEAAGLPESLHTGDHVFRHYDRTHS